MLATCSPVALNREETLSTLRYAASAKNIKTAAAKNEDPMEAKVRQLAEEIARLKAALEVAEAKGSGEGSDSGDAAGEAAAASSGSGGGDAILDSSSATGEGLSDALKSKSALLPNELDNLSEEERETYLQELESQLSLLLPGKYGFGTSGAFTGSDGRDGSTRDRMKSFGGDEGNSLTSIVFPQLSCLNKDPMLNHASKSSTPAASILVVTQSSSTSPPIWHRLHPYAQTHT